MDKKTLLVGGEVVSKGNETKKQDVLIEGNKIIKIADRIEVEADYVVLDCEDKLIMPGLVDLHVHLRDPGQEYKETIKTGSLAAAKGGYTTICAMPNTKPILDNVEIINKTLEKIQNEASIKVHLYSSITTGLVSDELVDFPAIANLVCGFTNDGVGVQTAGVMYAAMVEAKKVNKMLVAHTEDNSLLNGGVMAEGKKSKELNLPGIKSSVESSQIARDLILAHETGAHYHVCHLSTKESVNIIRFAKQMGVNVTCEVTPHHLLLTEDDIPGDDASYKMNPPLRSIADKEALILGLQDGTIDVIATDHAPHSEEEKSKGFLNSMFGIIGSEFAFELMYTELVKTGVFTLEQLIDLMSTKPGAILGMENTLTENNIADIAVVDLKAKQILKEEDIVSKSKNTPFYGKELYGKTIMTIVDGKVVYNA